jgi:nickel superoxide dismutase
MKKLTLALLVLGFVAFTQAPALMAHCEIPCGIYDDPARFTELREHITTIEKSIKKIVEISQSEHPDHNQLHRWVMNKEDHAEKFGNIVTAYFMRQRIKPSKTPGKIGNFNTEYVQKLVLLHELYVYSMKVKQSTDLNHIATLRRVLKRFETLYSRKH